MNRVNLVGRLTKEPDLRYTPSGVAVATFTLAVNRPMAKEGQQSADFIPCVVWRKPAENLANFIGKGALIGVEGKNQTRSYDGTDGKKVYVMEVVADQIHFLEPKNKGGGSTQNNGSIPTGNPFEKQSQFNDIPGKEINITDDDLPF